MSRPHLWFPAQSAPIQAGEAEFERDQSVDRPLIHGLPTPLGIDLHPQALKDHPCLFEVSAADLRIADAKVVFTDALQRHGLLMGCPISDRLFSSGFVGDALARELTAREHALTAVARRPSPTATLIGSVHDASLVAEMTAGAEVIVSALPPIDEDGGLPGKHPHPRHRGRGEWRPTRHRRDLGAAPAHPRRPALGRDSWLSQLASSASGRPSPHPGAIAIHTGLGRLALPRPAAEFGPHVGGARTGRYRTATTQLIDPDSRSWLGVADYALAFADELEQPTAHRDLLVAGY